MCCRQAVHAGLKREARAQRRLLEEHHHLLAGERVAEVRRPRFQPRREVKNSFGLVGLRSRIEIRSRTGKVVVAGGARPGLFDGWVITFNDSFLWTFLLRDFVSLNLVSAESNPGLPGPHGSSQ